MMCPSRCVGKNVKMVAITKLLCFDQEKIMKLMRKQCDHLLRENHGFDLRRMRGGLNELSKHEINRFW